MRNWREVTLDEVKEAATNRKKFDEFTKDIELPVNQLNEECPFPWETELLKGQPIGMYHCQFCGELCIAGVPHPDYKDESCSNST